MRNKLSTLQFHDKIFIAYGFIFLVMFGVVFGSARFLMGFAFKREIDAYVETLRARISNNYQAYLNTIEKDVHAIAADKRLLHAIKKESPIANIPMPDFDLFEYGTADSKLLYPNLKPGRNLHTYNRVDNEGGHIQLRYIPQQNELGLQFVVQVRESGEWGFVTGGYRLQTWLEITQTSIQSDEHPIFLVGKPQTSDTAGFSTKESDHWLPLNNAARHVPLDNRFHLLSGSQLRQKVTLAASEETEGNTYTASRITPFNAAFATTRETPPVDLIVAYSHARQMKWQRRLTLILLLSGVVGLALVYLISYIISRRITRPIATLREGVSHIAAGNLDHRVVIQSRGEIGQLADGFNQMARDLKMGLEERMAAERAATWRDVARQVAHEIKNPLNFIGNFSEIAMEFSKEIEELLEEIEESDAKEDIREITEDLGKSLDKIRDHSKRADNIVRSMLEHSRGGEGEWRETDLNATLKQYVELAYHSMRALNTGFNMDLVTELDPEIGPLEVVPQDISRVFLNLATNACQALDDKRKKEEDFEPVITISSKRLEKDAEFVLRDNGPGIPKKIRDKIFEPFFTTKEGTKGTGLGLSLTTDILLRHGGSIKVDSKEGEFTEMRIRMPLQSVRKAEEAAQGET